MDEAKSPKMKPIHSTRNFVNIIYKANAVVMLSLCLVNVSIL